MYEQLSLFDLDEPHDPDLETFIVSTGSHVANYEKRVRNEFEKNKAISFKWLKNEYGIGGWGIPHNKHIPEVTDVNWFGSRIDIKWYDCNDNEHEQNYTFSHIAAILTSMLKAGTFKHKTIDEANKELFSRG